MTIGLALALALIQDLTPKAAPGQTAVVTIDSIVEVEVKASDREGDKPDETSRTVLREEYTQVVLDAKDGRATRLKLSCDKSWIEKSGTRMPMSGQATPREGLTFDVTAGEAPKREDGGALPDGSGHIGRWEDFAELLKDAKTGTWNVGAKKLSLLSIGGKDRALEGQLSCAKQSVANGIATISFTGTGLTGTGLGEGETLKTDVKGKLLFDTNTGRPTQLSIEGSFAYEKKITHDEPGSENTTRRVEVGTVSVHSKEWSVDVKFKNP